MRLIFAGTPEPAVVALKKLIEDGHHEVVAVLTRPDARRGRGKTLSPSPVKALALEHNIPALTPTTLKDPEVQQQLADLAPDCIPVVAYGNLVPEALLDLPTHGWVNLHFSLLPAWRGAAPVQAAIAAGDEITGASTFRIEKGLDTGPVFGTVTEAIKPTDTADDLLTRLAYSGADLLAATMDGLEAGALRPTPQPDEGVSYAAKITPEDSRIVWTQPSHVIDRRARAFTPAPGAWTTLDGARIKVGGMTPLADADSDALEAALAASEAGAVADGPGAIVVEKHRVLVRCGDGFIQVDQVQAPGKKMMAAQDWARGAQPGGKVFE
nr:methionyl-tRNA formyltransferase [Corynebacterium lactis]